MINKVMQDAVLEKVGADAHVLELGAGEGTGRLADMFSKVTAVEHNEKWMLYPDRVNYIYAPLVDVVSHERFPSHDKWYDHKILDESLPGDYDAVIVDGPPGYIGRSGVINYGFKRKAVLWVFDDVWRQGDFRVMGLFAKERGRVAVLHPSGRTRWWGEIDCRK